MVQDINGKTIPEELYNLTQLAEVAASQCTANTKTLPKSFVTLSVTSPPQTTTDNCAYNVTHITDNGAAIGIQRHFELDNSTRSFITATAIKTTAITAPTIPPPPAITLTPTNKIVDYYDVTTTCSTNKTSPSVMPATITPIIIGSYHQSDGVGASHSIADDGNNRNNSGLNSGIYSDTSNSSDLDDKNCYSSTKKKWKNEWESNNIRNDNVQSETHTNANDNGVGTGIDDSSMTLSYQKDSNAAVTNLYCDQAQVFYHQPQQQTSQFLHHSQSPHEILPFLYQQGTVGQPTLEAANSHLLQHQLEQQTHHYHQQQQQQQQQRQHFGDSIDGDGDLRHNSITSSDDDSKFGYTHKVFDRKKTRNITLNSESSSYDESENNSNKTNCNDVSRRDTKRNGSNADEGKGSHSEDIHSCADCGKKYSTSSNLARHRQTHRSIQDKKAKRCPFCSKVYVSMPAYSMHVRTHNQGCQCPRCDKSFSRPWLLQGHLRTHTGEKPFKCVYCMKAFADKSNLRAHTQTHSNTKPHSCERCGKSFALKSYLYKHEESSCMKNHGKSDKGKSNSPVLRNKQLKKESAAGDGAASSAAGKGGKSSELNRTKLKIREKIQNTATTNNRISVIRTVSRNDKISSYHPKVKEENLPQSVNVQYPRTLAE